MSAQQETQQDPTLPEGFRIIREEDDFVIRFSIYEGNAATYENGEPRRSLSVELWKPRERFGGMSGPEISWPSTSDKRPVLAVAMAEALRRAAAEAVS